MIVIIICVKNVVSNWVKQKIIIVYKNYLKISRKRKVLALMVAEGSAIIAILRDISVGTALNTRDALIVALIRI